MMIEMCFDFESTDDDFYSKSDDDFDFESNDNFDFESNDDDFDFQIEIWNIFCF